MKRLPRLRWVLVSLGLLLASHVARAALPEAPPDALGFDPDRLARIDAALEAAVEHGKVPGAVVVVGRRSKIALARVKGRRSVEGAGEPLTRDTAFDLASLTKPVATATSMMILVEQGKLRLSDTLARLMPEFDNHGKGAITVEQLLRHRSGLIADNAIGDYADGPDEAWKRLATLDLVNPPGTRFRYSDVNFLILGKLVERVAGEPLDRFAAAHVFGPLGMISTGFRPIGQKPNADVPLDRIAPTETDGGAMLRGMVHDPRARALGGVAGHAGLFGTADDLAVFAQMILDGGLGPDHRRILAPLTVRAWISPGDTPDGQKRGLGWDIDTGYSAPRGDLFGPRSFGHTGFTGTSVWIDPETETFVILLTSRLHPDGKGASPTALRAEVATLTAAALVDPGISTTPNVPALPTVACGIDVLARDGFAPLRG